MNTCKSIIFLVILMIIFLFIFTLLGVQIFGSKVSIIPNGKMETSWSTFTDSFLYT
ncbi:MAG: ion transporter, partial [bacterium]